MTVTRIFKLCIKLAAWATPHVKEWHLKRNLNLTEADRHLTARNWADAEHHLVLALAERRHTAKKQIELLSNLATARSKQNKFPEAEQTVQAALEKADQSRDQPMRSHALATLVDIQLDQKKYGEAEGTIRAIEAIETDRARLAQCSRKLGAALLNSGRAEEASAALHRAAALSEQAFGAQHQHTAQTFAELGMLSRQIGQHEEAQRCLRKALDIHRATSGADSHESTQALYHLAASLEESGDYQSAVDEYERMLRLKERQVGGNREEAIDVQVRLAALYVKAGRIGSARELLTQAIGALERKGGPQFAFACEVFAVVEQHMGNPREAAAWRARSAQVQTV
ncbi:MAG TPA: tetratricopeptide repeat protein [Bryobacteraceae bacterium]|nr:tetratricopeptide repeat protein [Bryobacteraceae bacterium]